jgi:Na+-translocating ferredoxin:NAD+ oxidoreductase RnfD subunit
MKLLKYIAFFISSLSISAPAMAAGKLYYGSRAGMTVTVISLYGINSDRCFIVTAMTCFFVLVGMGLLTL